MNEMKMDRDTLSAINRLQRRSLMTGIAALAVCGVGAFLSPVQFFRSYLFAYLFWIGVALGSLAITLLHHLSGGRWGAVIRRFLEASIRTLPLLLLLFLPVLLGMNHLYEWTSKEHMNADAILKHKSIYLNVPFFLVRAGICFGVWLFLAYLLNKWSEEEDENGDPKLQAKFQFIGGFGLLLYGLTMTFASVDWMMSLEPHWFSTIYGLMVVEGQVLSAFAFTIIIVILMSDYRPLSEIISPLQFHDLGKLLFAFVMIWAYLGLSQFLIIWSGNLPEEIPWYLHRLHNGWHLIGIGLLLFHFTVPLLLLLSRNVKRNPRTLIWVALGVFLMRFVDLFYLVGPEFYQNGLRIHFMDVLMPAGIGGIWFAYFLNQLKSFPLIPVNDPNLPEAIAHARS